MDSQAQANVQSGFRRIARKLPFYTAVGSWLRRRRLESEVQAWARNGRPVPPPQLVKQKLICALAGERDLLSLIHI